MSGCATLASLAVLFFAAGTDAFQGSNDGRLQMALQFEGQVGCRFSTLICGENEECVDDDLFGNCQKTVLPKDAHRYRLTKGQMFELEKMLQLLVERGYTWHSRFTQCILVNSLISYRYNINLNLGLCGPFGKTSDENLRMVESVPPAVEESFPSDLNGRERFDRGALRKAGVSGDFPDVDSMHGVKTYGDRKRWVPHESGKSRGNHPAADEDVENFDEFVGHLSQNELQNLKEFLIEEESRSAGQGQGRVVKKSPPMVTNVVVHYIPGVGKESDSSKEKEMESKMKTESSDKDLATAEQMFSSGGASQKILEPKDKEPDRETPQLKYSGHQRTGLLQNPLPVKHLMTVSSPGSQLGLTTVMAAVGAQGKDVSHVRYEPIEAPRMSNGGRTRQYLITMYFLCGVVGVIIAAALSVYVMRRHVHLKEKISKWTGSKGVDETTGEYQDLCRQHMQVKLTEKVEPVPKSSRVEMISSAEQAGRTTSTGSSTSSWTEEPVSSNMDISTGHIILSYMEDHLTNKDRLQKEWDSLCAYDAEPCSIVAAIDPTNMRKNRYTDILPYEHSRVKLNPVCNVSGSDYINACTITDHDPRNPAYIAAQGPLPHTVADFWQMVWEQGSVVIVNLTRLTENTISVCHRYWPEEGSDLYHIYEVHLISEHAWCDDYVVRSFFLKNLQTNETRTTTQFHFLTWPNLGIPSSTKTLLDFRRKVNKSYRGRSCPIIVHCSDGAGRSGTYCLIDMALNRLHKGAKEIDIAATLEHIRDQRANMVRTKEQFEFVLAAVAEEVHAIVHVPQTQ